MKRTTYTILLIMALGLLSSSPANAAVKPGDVCKKVGAKSISRGAKFTCTKSGKKLVWKKVIQQTLPTEDVEIPISIDNLDIKAVPKKAYANVVSALNSRTRSTYTPIKHVGQNVKQSRMDQEVAGLNRAIDLWSPYFQPDVFQVILVGL